MKKINYTNINKDVWQSLQSMFLDYELFEEPFNNHALLYVTKNDTFSMHLGFDEAVTFESSAKSIEEIYNHLLKNINEVSQNSYEQKLGLNNEPIIADRAAIVLNMAANKIARDTIRGAGNIALVTQKLYDALKDSNGYKEGEICSLDNKTIEFILYNHNITVFKLDDFEEFFPNCQGIIMYWRNPTDGPFSIRYMDKDGELQYDIKAMDEVLDVDNNPAIISRAHNYIVRLVD